MVCCEYNSDLSAGVYTGRLFVYFPRLDCLINTLLRIHNGMETIQFKPTSELSAVISCIVVKLSTLF